MSLPPLGRRRLLGAAAALAAPALLPIRPARAAGQVVVGCWGGDYADILGAAVDKRIIAPMGIDVVQDVANPEARKTKLIAERGSKHGSMDVACLGDTDMYQMSLLELFHPITATEVPNLINAFPELAQPYAVPQIYSALVVVYNPERVKPAPQSFADMFDPKWQGRLGFATENYAPNIAAATLAAGGTMNDYAPGMTKLMQYKAHDPKLYPSVEAVATALKSEEIWLTPMWLARGYMWRKAGIPVAHVVPEEGAIPVTFQASVPRNAPDLHNGLIYLNALLDPRAQVAFADRMGYIPTVRNANLPEGLMPEIGFTEGQRARFRKPNYDYLAKNMNKLLDFWNKSFAAS